MDELEAVQRLLAQPPPGPEVVEAARASLGWAGGEPVHLNGGGHLFDERRPASRRRPAGRGRSAMPRHWPGWLAPVAAAAAVVAAIAAALGISGAIGHHQGGAPRPATAPDAAVAVARAGVPRYYVALPGPGSLGTGGTTATVGVTATGAVRGTVTAPKPYNIFSWASASANDRVFVLAARRPSSPMLDHSRFYRLTLGRSGRPGPLVPLPIPPQTGNINGFALSPDGTKLAVSFLPEYGAPDQRTSLAVFTLATGAVRTWVWPASGVLGWNKPTARSLAWEADNRTLEFQERTNSGPHRGTAGAYLLDTNAPSGSLPAASTRIPIPSQELSGMVEGGLQISGPILITGDGTTIVGPTSTTTAHGGPTRQQSKVIHARALHQNQILEKDRTDGAPASVIRAAQRRLMQILRTDSPTYSTVVTITEFSVKTGRPVLVLDRQVFQNLSQGSTDVQWVGTSGTSMLVDISGPPERSGNTGSVLGVQDGTTFTPLPPRVQRAFQAEQMAW
jgi:hypothetical protein